MMSQTEDTWRSDPVTARDKNDAAIEELDHTYRYHYSHLDGWHE